LISAGIVGVIWRVFTPLNIGWNWAPLVALFLALEFGFVNLILGLGRVEWSRAVTEDILLLFFSSGVVTVISAVVDLYVSSVNLPNGYALAVSLVTLMGFIVSRYRLRLVTGFAKRWVDIRHQGYGVGERVLVVGAGSGGEMIVWLLQRPEFQRLFHITGYVDDDPGKQGMRYDGYSILGTTADLPKLIKEQDIGVVFFTIHKMSADERDRIFSLCRKAGARLILLSDVLKSIEEQLVVLTAHE
jgi:FlaA1/EpsC-like NDP-sugar epimerase